MGAPQGLRGGGPGTGGAGHTVSFGASPQGGLGTGFGTPPTTGTPTNQYGLGTGFGQWGAPPATPTPQDKKLAPATIGEAPRNAPPVGGDRTAQQYAQQMGYALPGPNGTTQTFVPFTDEQGYASFMGSEDYGNPDAQNPYAFRATYTDEEGNTYEAKSVITSEQIAYESALLGMTTEEYIAANEGYGYKMVGDDLAWDGGMGAAAPNNEPPPPPWWSYIEVGGGGFKHGNRHEHFQTEKSAQTWLRRDRLRAKRRGDKKEEGGGVVTATSVLGAG